MKYTRNFIRMWLADSKYFGKRPNINTFIHEGKNAKTQQNSYLTLGQPETLHFFPEKW